MRMRAMVAGLAMGLASAAAAGQTGGKLLVVEKGAQSLGILDLRTGAVVSVAEEKLAGRDTGHEVAVSRDGRWAYVPIYGDSGVGKPGTDGREMVVVDVTAGRVAQRLDFGHAVRPHLPVLGPPVAGHPGGLLYVTTELDRSVTVVDPERLTILGQVPTGSAESHMLAVSHDGRRGYTANVGPGTVSVLDLVGRKLVRVIGVARAGETTEVQRISISMDDRWVFTSDQRRPELDAIDTASNAVERRVALPSFGYGSAPTPDGRWLLVAMMGVDGVAVVDLGRWTVARTIELGTGMHPQAVVVSRDGRRAWVSCDVAGSVAEIDLETWKVTRKLAVGKLADGMAVVGGE